jgi:PKD domain
VAVLDPISLEATTGEVIEFDGSKSYDEDGEIVGYQWDFGDAIQVAAADSAPNEKVGDPGTTALQTHVYNEAGQYFVTLTVTDDKGATASVQAEVHVAAAPSVSVKVAFTPHILDLNSRGDWITATIRVPSGYDARQIEVASVQIAPDGGTAIAACTNTRHGFFRSFFKKYRSRQTLTLKFDRQTLSEALAGASGTMLLKVEGKLRRDKNLVDFSGAGTINVIGKHKKQVQHGKRYGRR